MSLVFRIAYCVFCIAYWSSGYRVIRKWLSEYQAIRAIPSFFLNIDYLRLIIELFNGAFWHVSFAYWRFMFACWPLRDRLTFAYYTMLSNKSQEKKRPKSTFFLAALFPIEIRTLSPIISLKRAKIFWLTPACGCAGSHPGGRQELRFCFVMRVAYCVCRIVYSVQRSI